MSKVFSPRNSIWLFWILATSTGSTLGFIIGNRVLNVLAEDFHYALLVVIYLAIIGLFIGVGQWVVLRSLHKRANLWIIATTIGFSVGFSIIFWIYPFLAKAPNIRLLVWIFSSITVGMFMGTFQWITLHRNLTGSFTWLLISGLSWGMAMTIIERMINGHFLTIDGSYADLIVGILFGLLVGILSGAVVADSLVHPENAS